MTDREKVIKGLEYCIDYAQRVKDLINDVPCAGCPYVALKQIKTGQGDCIDVLFKDALALLKAQQPRLLTLEEVIAHYSLPPVFPDDFGMQEDYYEDIQPLYFEFPCDNEDPWIVHWRGYAQVARYLDEWRHSYNKKWRCWTSRPTDEQREAEPWISPQ